MTPEQNAALDAATIERESGAGLLPRVEAFLRRFVAYPSEHALVAHTLWCVHTHLMDTWHTTPRLAFMSAEPESGKTRCLEISELLCASAVLASDASPAAIVREVSKGPITILYDEIDSLYGSFKTQEMNVDVTRVLNSGYRRGAKVLRCVTHGKKVETEYLYSFAPVAVAGLRELPDALATRAIFIRMKKRAPGEHVDDFIRCEVEPQAEAIRLAIEAWCTEIADSVPHTKPKMPPGITDRKAECWWPLLAVADAAGGDWPKRARKAATQLTRAAEDTRTTRGVELLGHIREVFAKDEKLWSADLLDRLQKMPESPWQDVKGKPLDQRGLAMRLKPYDVRSKDIWITGDTKKGYTREDLHDAWTRYLPPIAPRGDVRDVREEIDNKDKNLADLADLAARRVKAGNGGNPPNEAEQDKFDAFEERAAVLEHEAGMTREEAERTANIEGGSHPLDIPKAFRRTAM